MTKGELVEFLQPFADDIDILVDRLPLHETCEVVQDGEYENIKGTGYVILRTYALQMVHKTEGVDDECYALIAELNK